MKQLLINLVTAVTLGTLLIYAAYQQRGYLAAGGECLLFAGLVTAAVVKWRKREERKYGI